MSDTKQNKRAVGNVGESVACDFLKSNGYEIICRNYYCPYGEIDIIAENDKFYAGYIARNEREIAAYKRDANMKIPVDFKYDNLPGLTNELIEKLNTVRPENIADLSRIPGMTPAGIMVVLRKIKA